MLKLAADAEEGPCALDIPHEIKRREDRLAAIARAKAAIGDRAAARFAAEQDAHDAQLKVRERRARETGRQPGGRPPQAPPPGPRAQDQVNLTDDESRIMPSSEGFQPCDHAQASVDEDSHLVTATHVSQNANDKREIAPTLDALAAVADTIGVPEAILADSGYFSRANVERCVAAGITPMIAVGRQKHNRPLETTPQAPQPGPPPDADAVERMRQRMQTSDGQAIYAKRKATVETVFGIIKGALGFRRFQRRGHTAATQEWSLICMAWNLKRMHKRVQTV